MSRMLHRAVAALLAVPLAAAVGIAPAAADDVTVPGCYGVSVVVCDPTVEYGLPAGVETYSTVVPICAGACQDVPVTLVRTTAGEPLALCASYENRQGAVTRECAAVPNAGALVDFVVGLVLSTIADADEILADARALADSVVELVLATIARITEDLPDLNQLLENLREALGELLAQRLDDIVERLQDVLDEIPSRGELVDAVEQIVNSVGVSICNPC